MSHSRAIFSNTVTQVLGKVLTAIFGIAAVKILTSYLGKESYGAYNTVYIYLSFFSIVADLGIYTIAVREMARKKERIAEVFGNIVSIRTVLSIVVVLVACVMAYFIPQYRESIILMGILISAPGTIISLINGVIVSIFQTTLKMQYSTLSLLIGKVLSVGSLILIAYVLFPEAPTGDRTAFYAAMTAGLISSIGLILTTLFYARRIVSVSYRFDWAVWKELIRESLPFGIALILGTVYLKVDGLMLSLMKGNAEVGLYSAATKAIEVLNVLPVMIVSTVLPVMTEYYQEKSGKLSTLLRDTLSVLTVIAWPVLVGLWVTSYQVIATIATPEFVSDRTIGFVGSDAALKVLSISLFLSFINSLFIYLLITVGLQKKLLWINGSAVVINILLNLVLIPQGGFVAASWTTVFSEALVLGFTFYYGYRAVKFPIDWIRLAKIILSGLAMGVVLMYAKEPVISALENKGIIILVALGGIVYAAGLLLTRAFTFGELKTILKKDS